MKDNDKLQNHTQCPCYPNCDKMMEQNQIPRQPRQEWQDSRRSREWWPQGPNNMPWYSEDTPMMRQMMPQQPMKPQQPISPRAFAPENLEQENEQDWMRIREMYPETARVVQNEVEQVCDKMEYEGSMMFDEMPEKARVWKMTDEIMGKIREKIPGEEGQEKEEQGEMFTMNREPCRNCRPSQSWLGDLIQVMLYQEMFRRRCRHRGCRRW